MSTSSLKDVTGKDSENASNSSSSNGEGGGNNSDNSALVSLGNTSFGFNFESDGGFNNSSGSRSPSEEGDSDQGDRKPKAGNGEGNNSSGSNSSTNAQTTSTLTSCAPTGTETGRSSATNEGKEKTTPQHLQQANGQSQLPDEKLKIAGANSIPISAGAAAAKISSDAMKQPPVAASTASVKNESTAAISNSPSHNDAAAIAVANLNQIATDASKKTDAENDSK